MDERAGRTADRGQAVEDSDGVVHDLNVVKEAELDDVKPQLRVEYLAQGIGDVLGSEHRSSLSTGESSPARPPRTA